MSSLPKTVVCYGEVLWDILPDKKLPGGAPMNVAYHLQQLGTDTALITRIGDDEYGKSLVDYLTEKGVTTQYFQTNNNHATGLVYAKLNQNNEVTYDIVFPSAWDFIQWQDDYIQLISQSEFFVFGSLTSRNQVSRNTLYQLLEHAKRKVLDINLRPPHYERTQLEYLLEKTDILKVNSSELELIAGWFSPHVEMEDQTKVLRDHFNLETVIVTMGGNGALVNDKGTIQRHPGFKVQVADTIGSGDAFLAGFLHKKIKGASVLEALTFAGGMGAFIASRFGACPTYELNDIEILMNAKEHQNENTYD